MTPRERARQIAQDFPARLKAARKNSGLTQEQLAEKAECSTVALSKFESGVNLPTFENLFALSLAMEMSVSELVGSPGEASDGNLKLAAAKVRLNQAISDLSPEWIDTLTDVAKKAQ